MWTLTGTSTETPHGTLTATPTVLRNEVALRNGRRTKVAGTQPAPQKPGRAATQEVGAAAQAKPHNDPLVLGKPAAGTGKGQGQARALSRHAAEEAANPAADDPSRLQLAHVPRGAPALSAVGAALPVPAAPAAAARPAAAGAEGADAAAEEAAVAVVVGGGAEAT